MEEDKRDVDAILSISMMFPAIDKETITDIYLGCKKNLDQTIDQLIGMGAEQEVKKPAPTPVAPTVVPTPVPTPKEVKEVHDFPTFTQEASHHVDSPAEKARLELLNQQLSMEYRRLADTQEKNVLLAKQLESTKASIAIEQARLEEERKRLDEQQVAFQADKKRLEEHLSSRLREMKEQMRRNEELNRVQEEENKIRAELERQEELKLAEQIRIAEKEAKRERKFLAKEEKRHLKALERSREEKSMEYMKVEYETKIRLGEDLVSTLRDELSASQADIARLREEVAFLSVKDNEGRRDAALTLQSVVGWLAKAVDDIQDRDIVSSDNVREKLLRSLQQHL